MEAYHWVRPTAAEAGAIGLSTSDYLEPVADVWPEAWDALTIYGRVQTQWRTGPGGLIGLDYTVIHRELDAAGYTGQAWTDVMDAIRVIEGAARTELMKA